MTVLAFLIAMPVEGRVKKNNKKAIITQFKMPEMMKNNIKSHTQNASPIPQSSPNNFNNHRW